VTSFIRHNVWPSRMNISPRKKVENDSCHVAHEVKDTREKSADNFIILTINASLTAHIYFEIET